ncbi:hypothetical protein ACU6TU_09750 [Halomonas sp. LS-001]
MPNHALLKVTLPTFRLPTLTLTALLITSLGGCAALPSHHPDLPPAHPTAALLNAPLTNAPERLDHNSLARGPVKTLNYYADCQQACDGNYIKYRYWLDEQGRETRREFYSGTGIITSESHYEGDAKVPVMRTYSSSSSGYSSKTYYRRDEHDNALSYVQINDSGEKYTYQRIFRKTAHGMRVSSNPAYETDDLGMPSPANYFQNGRIIRQETKDYPTINLSTGASGTVDAVYQYDYSFYPNGQLQQEIKTGFDDGEKSSVYIDQYSPEGLLLVDYFLLYAPYHPTYVAYDQYRVDEQGNWTHRRKCLVNSDDQRYECRNEQQLITYY